MSGAMSGGRVAKLVVQHDNGRNRKFQVQELSNSEPRVLDLRPFGVGSPLLSTEMSISEGVCTTPCDYTLWT